MPSIGNSTRTFMPSQPEKKKDKPAKVRKMPSLNNKVLPWAVATCLLLFSLFMFGQYQTAKSKLRSEGTTKSSRQVNDVISRVSKLIILPQDEKPTIVTVKDASKLKGEQFYAEARNGDVTLVYSQAKKAILYRPSADVIVNVANVTVTSNGTN
jgi:hypothetical protein